MDAFYALSEQHQIYAVCAACVLSIVAYGTFRCNQTDFTDPLTKAAFGPPLDKFLDGWGLLHFGFYFVLAYAFPSQWALIAFLGILWEMVETFFKDKPFYIAECKYRLTTDQGEGWWYGRWQDIVMNTGGILLALRMRGRI